MNPFDILSDDADIGSTAVAATAETKIDTEAAARLAKAVAHLEGLRRSARLIESTE